MMPEHNAPARISAMQGMREAEIRIASTKSPLRTNEFNYSTNMTNLLITGNQHRPAATQLCVPPWFWFWFCGWV
jgi:hypothetical protein